jgi:hypothetical protein
MVDPLPSDITPFARTTFRNERKLFGIKRADRRYHLYAIGKTGTGKSTLLETLIRSDLLAGEGVAVFDPHGELVEHVLPVVPESRQSELLHLNLPDPTQPYRFNPLADVPPASQPLAAAGLIEVFKKLWADFWGVRLEHVLRNALLALLEHGGATLADIPRLFDDDRYRRQVVAGLANEQVRSFWLGEFERYPPSRRSEVIGPVQNKVGAFLADPRVFRVLTAPGTLINLRSVMDRRQILLVNLAKGQLGEGPAALMGALLVASLGLAGLSRSDVPVEARPDLYLYLDEFQTFATLSLATMLAELRKYRVNLILANQYLGQLDPAIRDAVLGNVGTLVVFRVGAPDASLLARELAPKFSAQDLLTLPNWNFYVKLMINGEPSRAFSGETLPL